MAAMSKKIEIETVLSLSKKIYFLDKRFRDFFVSDGLPFPHPVAMAAICRSDD